MKVNILKELDSKREETKKELDPITEAKFLLEDNSARERYLLKQIGLGHQIIKMEEKQGIDLERTKLENQFDGKIFTTEEIKAICMDYDLRFLRNEHYKGSVDPQLGPIILRFFEKNKIEPNYIAHQFYIMAPKEAFNLQDKPKPPVFDPVLFYRPSIKDDKYLLVHKWGNDFTVARLLRGFVRRSFLHNMIFRMVLSTLILNILFASFGSYRPFIDLFLISLPIGALLGFLSMIPLSDNTLRDVSDSFNDKTWNSIYKS